MRVAVTGATGFLGRRVVSELVDRGTSVRAVARVGPAATALQSLPGVEVWEGDLRTDDLASLLQDVDVLVHLAAQVTGSDEARFAGTAASTERLLDAARSTGLRRLVHVSSYSVYDWDAASDVLDERTPVLQRPYGRDGYAVAKVWQERLVWEFAASTSAGVTVLRPGFIWGAGREDLAGAGLRLGPALLVVGPRMRLPLTYVDNCAQAVAAAALSPDADGEVLNVVDGPGVASWRYGRFLQELDDSVKVRVPLPYAFGRALVAVLAVVMPRIFKAGGKLPGVLVPASYVARFRPLRHSAEKATRVLGWSPSLDFEAATSICLEARQKG